MDGSERTRAARAPRRWPRWVVAAVASLVALDLDRALWRVRATSGSSEGGSAPR